MRILLELITAKFETDFLYLHEFIDISNQEYDPDQIATDYLRVAFLGEIPKTIRDKYILHSTSWRYEVNDIIILTYIAFSEHFNFNKRPAIRLPVKQIRIAESLESTRPRPRSIEVNAIVSHAFRHLAFLINRDERKIYIKILKPKTLKVFKKLNETLAGRIS